MVELAGARGRYRLGLNILRLAEAVTGTLEISTQGVDACTALSALIGETVNVAVRQGDSAVNVYQAEGTGAVRVDSWVGRRTPLHATSSGKVLLAWPHLAPAVGLESGFARFTEHTITDPTLLRTELDRVRAEGWATTLGELEDGLNAIAAPIFGANGTVIGALSASGPAYRWSAEVMAEHALDVVAAADSVSALMGYRG
nr:IclR family transcriptional regulator [Cryobacterium roopkundense]